MRKLKPVLALLTVSIFSKSIDIINDTMNIIENNFGKIKNKSEFFEFDPKHYYEKEMGSPLFKIVCTFDQMISLENISRLKHKTIDVEKEVSFKHQDECRIVNIDPGFIDLYRFSLLSTKDAPHRMYIGEGIWQENTLSYLNHQWVSHELTYPDYKFKTVHSVLSQGRENFKSILKNHLELNSILQF